MLFGAKRKTVSKGRDKTIDDTEPFRGKLSERASLPSSGIHRLRAGMTVEAALVLPLFIFFMAQLLYIFGMIRLQSRFLQALHETGTQMAEYAFYTEYAVSDIISSAAGLTGSDTIGSLETLLEEESALTSLGVSLVLSETYVRSSVEEYLGEEYMDNSCLSGGASSVSYLQSQILVSDDIIDIVADYRIAPFMSMFGLDGFSVQTRYYGHAWTGYTIGETAEASDDAESEGETIVYITATGSVYHLSADCTYLKPSTILISAAEVDSARNSEGSKYYACEICNPTKTGTLVITEDGNRYHSSTSCSALKRTVIEVYLSQVEDSMNCCSKCGG